MTVAAELLDDGGAGAASEEFFRSPPFLAAEGVTHSLRIGPLCAPVVVREIEGSESRVDAISPYGYPGFDGRAEPAIDPATVDFSSTGLVSAFIRHRLGSAAPLVGARQRNLAQIADPALEPKSRMSDRQQIRRNQRRGYAVEVVPGPDSSEAQRAAFLAAYEQTMRRTGAAPRYFYDDGYFDGILTSSRTSLCLALAPGGGLAAASIAAVSDGMLHYYLSGTADEHLRDSPMKNLLASLIEFAWEGGLPLNLGGGLSPGDRLEEFKRGFANRSVPWRTSELVCDRGAYERLSADREPGDFFPAYRA